jgi:hypothetical protein
MSAFPQGPGLIQAEQAAVRWKEGWNLQYVHIVVYDMRKGMKNTIPAQGFVLYSWRKVIFSGLMHGISISIHYLCLEIQLV